MGMDGVARDVTRQRRNRRRKRPHIYYLRNDVYGNQVRKKGVKFDRQPAGAQASTSQTHRWSLMTCIVFKKIRAPAFFEKIMRAF